MNELHTPPGFVEYPRDSLSRRADLDRLDVMVRGFGELRLVYALAPLLCFVEFKHASFGAILIPIHVVVVSALFATTWTGLGRIYRAKGWSLWIALVLCLLPGIIETVRDLRVFPDLPLLGLLFGAFLAIVWSARGAVAGQVGQLGGKMPPWYALEKVPKVAAELRNLTE